MTSLFFVATSSRHGSPRRPGQGGRLVGTSPGTTGSISRDGVLAPVPIVTFAVPAGNVCSKLQIGWSPLGALTWTRMREPLR